MSRHNGQELINYANGFKPVYHPLTNINSFDGAAQAPNQTGNMASTTKSTTKRSGARNALITSPTVSKKSKDNETSATKGFDQDLAAAVEDDMTLTSSTKRKAPESAVVTTHSPPAHCKISLLTTTFQPTPPSKKQSTAKKGSATKNPISRLQAETPALARTSSRKPTGVTTSSSTPRNTLGARSFAKLALPEHDDPSRNVQPIRRPLPKEGRPWNSGDSVSLFLSFFLSSSLLLRVHVPTDLGLHCDAITALSLPYRFHNLLPFQVFTLSPQIYITRRSFPDCQTSLSALQI